MRILRTVFTRARWWFAANADRWPRQSNITRIVRELYPAYNRMMRTGMLHKIAGLLAEVKPGFPAMEARTFFKNALDKSKAAGKNVVTAKGCCLRSAQRSLSCRLT